jgi:hypothetical protein
MSILQTSFHPGVKPGAYVPETDQTYAIRSFTTGDYTGVQSYFRKPDARRYTTEPG